MLNFRGVGDYWIHSCCYLAHNAHMPCSNLARNFYQNLLVISISPLSLILHQVSVDVPTVVLGIMQSMPLMPTSPSHLGWTTFPDFHRVTHVLGSNLGFIMIHLSVFFPLAPKNQTSGLDAYSKANSEVAPSQPPSPPQCSGLGVQSLKVEKGATESDKILQIQAHTPSLNSLKLCQVTTSCLNETFLGTSRVKKRQCHVQHSFGSKHSIFYVQHDANGSDDMETTLSECFLCCFLGESEQYMLNISSIFQLYNEQPPGCIAISAWISKAPAAATAQQEPQAPCCFT